MNGKVRRIAGISLLEFLVAMALGVMLVLAVGTLHARILFLSAESTRTADAQDTLRIALAVLEYELWHTGYWGLVPDATQIAGRHGDTPALDATVAGDCGAGWAIDLQRAVEAWTGDWPFACSPFGGVPPHGGGLVLRRVDARLASPDEGVLQVQADPWGGRLTAAGEPADPGMEVRNLVARAYYVSPRSTGDPLRPSLRRKTLQRGPRIVDEEVVPGIAELRVELGVDTDPEGASGHGQVNLFLSPDAASGRIRAVRITLRADDPAGMMATRTIALRNGPGS